MKTTIRVIATLVMAGLLSLILPLNEASASSWSAEQLHRMAIKGEIASGMWGRGEFEKKFKGGCGWSNADATYRVTNLGMKLEALATAANLHKSHEKIYNLAEVLAREINKSSMYQECFGNMLDYDFRKPARWIEQPRHPYGQDGNPNHIER